MSGKRSRHLKALQDRADHIARRIAASESHGLETWPMRRERHALLWAISELSRVVDPTTDTHLVTWMRQRADEWESRTSGTCGAGKRATYRTCADEIRSLIANATHTKRDSAPSQTAAEASIAPVTPGDESLAKSAFPAVRDPEEPSRGGGPTT